MGTCVHFSRSLPSNSWWQTMVGCQVLSRPSAAEGGGRRPAFTGPATQPYSATEVDGWQQLSRVSQNRAAVHNALSVVAFNTAEGWSWDVSEDIAGEVLERAFNADDNLSEDTKRFIDRHMAPGEKRPPAPSVRRDAGADLALRVGGRKTGQ
jgi:hypothetical protein